MSGATGAWYEWFLLLWSIHSSTFTPLNNLQEVYLLLLQLYIFTHAKKQRATAA